MKSFKITASKVNSYFKNIPIWIYVFVLSVLYRLPSLGFDFIGNDDFHWKERGYAFGKALSTFHFADTAVTYHPGVTLLYSQFIAIKLYTLITKLGYTPQFFGTTEFLLNHVLQKVCVVVLTAALTAMLYSGLAKIFSRKTAALIVLVLALEPFYTALSRAIHIDVLMSLFSFNAFVYLWISMLRDEKVKNLKRICDSKYLIYSGIFLGFALLTKSSALFIPLFFVVIYVLSRFANLMAKVSIKNLAVLFAIASVIFFIFWSAMWVDPIGTLKLYFLTGIKGTAIDEGHEHLWFGVITDDPGPLFYPVAIAARFSAVLLISFFIGIFYMIKNKIKIPKEIRDFLLLCLIYFAGYLTMISIASKKLDRYEIPLFFPVAVLACYYVERILNRRRFFILAGTYIVSGLAVFYGIHPNYLAYYSPLVGGMQNGIYVIEPTWLVGYDKVAAYFNNKKDVYKIRVAIADFDYLVPFAKFTVVNVKSETEAKTADYFVLPSYREDRNSFYDHKYHLEWESDITIAGVKYYTVFKVKKSDTPKI